MSVLRRQTVDFAILSRFKFELDKCNRIADVSFGNTDSDSRFFFLLLIRSVLENLRPWSPSPPVVGLEMAQSRLFHRLTMLT